MKSKTRIILTGTGAGEPPYISPDGTICDRHHPSALFIIEKGNEKFYFCIDFTLYMCDALIKLKVPSSKINVVFITHGHEDHVNFFRWISAKVEIGGIRLKYDLDFSRNLMNLYAPKPVVRALARMFNRINFNPIRSIDSKLPREETCFEYSRQGYKKPVLIFRGVPSGTKIKLPLNIEVLCVGVKHKYDSAISRSGRGDTTFGYLVSIEDDGIRFNILYLTDYEQMNLGEKARFKKKIKRYPLDLCILGMPIPFPERDKKERPHGQRHMGIEDTMSFFKKLQDEGFVKPKARAILTHISDREKDEKELKEEKEVIRKYWNPKLFWIPKNDGFQITYSRNRLTKKGMTI